MSSSRFRLRPLLTGHAPLCLQILPTFLRWKQWFVIRYGLSFECIPPLDGDIFLLLLSVMCLDFLGEIHLSHAPCANTLFEAFINSSRVHVVDFPIDFHARPACGGDYGQQ